MWACRGSLDVWCALKVMHVCYISRAAADPQLLWVGFLCSLASLASLALHLTSIRRGMVVLSSALLMTGGCGYAGSCLCTGVQHLD